MDKASLPHFQSKKVQKYFDENKDTSIPVYSNNCIARVYGNDGRNTEHNQIRSFVLKYYTSLADLNKISIYFRTKRFNLNMRNYRVRDVW
jgi:hypothetical protein